MVVVLGASLLLQGQNKESAAPGPITLYADADAGTPVVFSLVFDNTKFRLAGTPQTSIHFLVKEEYKPDPTPSKPNENWIPCPKVTANANDENCGKGKANMYFNNEDGVPAWGQDFGTKWITTVKAHAQTTTGQAWRARITVDVVPR